MKANPGKTGRIFDALLALKGKRVVVVDETGTRYGGFLQFEGQFVKDFAILDDTESPGRPVLEFGPITRILEITGATIKVNLSMMIDIWFERTLENESFLGSEIAEVQLHEAQPLPSPENPTEATAKRIHYLAPGQSINRLCLNEEGVVVWVGNDDSVAIK